MEVIAHQHVRVNGHAAPGGMFFQQGEQRAIVFGRCKDRLPVVPALDDVVGIPGHREPWKACHESLFDRAFGGIGI
jgi:hypothetical protein